MQMLRAQDAAASLAGAARDEVQSTAADVALRRHLCLREDPQWAAHGRSALSADTTLRPDHDRGAARLTCACELRRRRDAVVHLDRRDLLGTHESVEIAGELLLPRCAVHPEYNAAAHRIARARDDVGPVAPGLHSNPRNGAQHVAEL